MERDHRDSPADLQSVWEYGGECLAEMVELLVDGNPQRLKDARGGMGLKSVPAAAGKGPGNCVNQLCGRAQRFFGALLDDAPRHRAAVAFFPVPEEKGRQLGGVERGQ